MNRLPNFTGLSGVKELLTEHTTLISITRINDHTNNLKFEPATISKDTKVYRVFALDHWDNLDESPRKLRYIGHRYLIYNETANCIKPLSEKPDGNVSVSCPEFDGDDQFLIRWTIMEDTDELERFVNEFTIGKPL